MKKIKVLIGANDLALAGVQRLVIDQLQNVDHDKFELCLVVLMRIPGRETFDNLVPKDVRVYQLEFRRLFDPVQWLRVVRVLRQERPDVVKTATFFSNTVFLVLQPFFGYAVVAAEHNTVAAKRPWQKAVDRLLLPRAFTVVGDSKMVVDFVSEEERIDKKHFTVVYNGVDLDAVERAQAGWGKERESVRAQYGIPADAKVVFSAGRLVKQKNHRLMFEAFSLVCAKRNDVYLVIAGEGALRHELEEFIQQSGLSGRVRLLQEQKDIFRLYAAADIFLLTSRHEGFCIAAMEGLAFGMPLISTRVAGVSEYLEDGKNGFFTDAQPEDIARKLLATLDMEPAGRARMSQSAKETAANYSIKRYGEAYNELLSRAAKSSLK